MIERISFFPQRAGCAVQLGSLRDGSGQPIAIVRSGIHPAVKRVFGSRAVHATARDDCHWMRPEVPGTTTNGVRCAAGSSKHGDRSGGGVCVNPFRAAPPAFLWTNHLELECFCLRTKHLALEWDSDLRWNATLYCAPTMLGHFFR